MRPDYLDPSWLQAASGHAVHSLDLWINGEDDCARRLAAAAEEADLPIVEDAMDLFDGDPSAADLAERFGIPVLGVIDAGAMAGTLAAVAHGLRSWRPRLPWAGVFANRVAGERHAAMLRNAVESPGGGQGGPWRGHLPHQGHMAVPERHLGLAQPQAPDVWLPGGYPEQHAARLAQRTDLRDQLAAHVHAGKPLWAECGGMMALAERLVDAEGHAHAMWGLLPGTAVLGRRLSALGPRALASGQPGPAPLRGHSFHWSTFETALQPAACTAPRCPAASATGEPLYERVHLRASWFHAWFPSSPRLAAKLFQAAPLFTSRGPDAPAHLVPAAG